MFVCLFYSSNVLFFFTSSDPVNASFSDLTNDTDPMTLALHKSWGQKDLSVTRGQYVKKVEDDFVVNLEKLHGDSELSYTLYVYHVYSTL